ncbi:hypothetical protein FB451DRAFT_1397043 [Mycena latifolia]|nr:hypothetical protein FB451DRAFT_1397043 [Mycena latifolia]
MTKPTTLKEDAPPEAPASIESNANATARRLQALACPLMPRPLMHPVCAVRKPSAARTASRTLTTFEVEADLLVGPSSWAHSEAAARDEAHSPSHTRLLLHEAKEEVEEKETRVEALRAELAGAVDSGKSWAMKGGRPEKMQGMIPRAVAQVFGATGQRQYLHDGGPAPSTRADHGRAGACRSAPRARDPPSPDDAPHRTTVSDARTPAFTGPAQAQAARRIAATRMSTRTQCPRGTSAGRTREGVLNRVDLAGSERRCGASVASRRLRVCALQEVRHSKLTYISAAKLAERELDDARAYLMVLNLSPLAAHLNESPTSLRFATKVRARSLHSVFL